MSRFGPVRCYECGNPLDDIYEAFEFMRAVINNHELPDAHVDKFYIDEQENKSVAPIFEVIGIKPDKFCCLSHLMTTVLPKDVEVD